MASLRLSRPSWPQRPSFCRSIRWPPPWPLSGGIRRCPLSPTCSTWLSLSFLLSTLTFPFSRKSSYMSHGHSHFLSHLRIAPRRHCLVSPAAFSCSWPPQWIQMPAPHYSAYPIAQCYLGSYTPTSSVPSTSVALLGLQKSRAFRHPLFSQRFKLCVTEMVQSILFHGSDS